jgi:hypothetical protein
MTCSEVNNDKALLKLAFGTDESSILMGSIGTVWDTTNDFIDVT